jgi:uncharacterized membrane protein
VYVLSTLLTPEKLVYALQIFVPLALLPLRSSRYSFLLFPGFFVSLLSTGYLPTVQIRYQYSTHFTPYVFIGAVLVLERLGEVVGGRAKLAAAVAFVAGTFFTTNQYGALQQRNFFSGGHKIEFEMSEAERAHYRDLVEIVATIPPDATLAATETDGPHAARRHELYTLKYDAHDAEYLLYSLRGLDIGDARKIVQKALREKKYGLFAQRPGIVVLRRGAPADRNGELLKQTQKKR